MPDEMPSILLEQGDRMAKTIGVPHPIRPEEAEIEVTDQIKEDLNKELDKVKTQMRFVEANEKSENTEKSKQNMIQRHFWLHVPFIRAWASSVYSWRWWWWHHSYPASNVSHFKKGSTILGILVINRRSWLG